jgi:hypothetical protein
MLLYRNSSLGPEVPYTAAGRVGSPGIPMFAHIAAPANAAIHYYSGPECTVTGPVCGGCSDIWARTIRHASVAHIRACWEAAQDCEAEAAAEWPLIRAGWL